MGNKTKLLGILILLSKFLYAQEIIFDKSADLKQAYGKSEQAEKPLTMNDLNVESGYILYEAEIETEAENEKLSIENVRDYATVYVDGKFKGILKDVKKTISLRISPGKHLLQLYLENIGRITYGPEITDNSKGLFGEVTLAGNDISNWKMIVLNIKKLPIQDLTFMPRTVAETPAFYQGNFLISKMQNVYLDVSGWGMGEVWINNNYLGVYWEEEKQQSILIPENMLSEGKNEIVIFELKNNHQKTMKLSQTPVFK